MFPNLSNEEKFFMADASARKIEQERGYKMSLEEYEQYVWDYIKQLYFPKYE